MTAVNPVVVLMGLLVLSYLGSFLVGGRTVSGAGLPSGVEYAALGFVLGPRVLDIVGSDMLGAFEPVVQVAIGWLAFGVGLDFGYVAERRVRFGSIALGTLSTFLTGGAASVATWYALVRLGMGGTTVERLLLAGGVGVACSETTRHAVRWVVERQGARGPLADRLNEIAHSDHFLPLLALAVLFALQPTGSVPVRLPLRDWPAITVGLGVLLGAASSLLLRNELSLEDAWGVLFGVSLIGIGAAARLSLSTLTMSFFAGLALSVLSRHREDLRAMVAPTERPVLLPALLLAGARLDFRASVALPWVAAAAIGARIVAKVVLGWVLAAFSRPARKGGVFVGLSLLSSGALAMSIGLAFALRFPGAIGDTVLVVAVLSATVGEFVGPVRLRRTLELAGEIESTGRALPAGGQSLRGSA
jgi:Kef-type K+ transport system membrane component KefB